MISGGLHRLRDILLLLGVSLILVWCLQGEASAQGCSMCKTAAEAQSEQAIEALGHAILFLLAPPVAIMGTILVYTFRRRSSDQD